MTVVPIPKRKSTTAVAKPYEPTEREIAAQAAYRKRCETKRPAPKMKVAMSEGDGKRIASLFGRSPRPGARL